MDDELLGVSVVVSGMLLLLIIIIIIVHGGQVQGVRIKINKRERVEI